MGKIKKACISAFLAAVTLLSGCGTAAGEVQVGAKAQKIADSFFTDSRGSYSAWKETDRSALAAYVTGTDDDAFFAITFGDFFSEYMYYLVLNRIDDDMSDENKAVCESYRDSMITYMTFERMYLYTAEKEYGISESTLTDAQKNEIRTEADEARKNAAAAFYTSAAAMLGDDAQEKDIEKLCSEVLEAVLRKCGLNGDIYRKWETIKYIEELTLAKAVGDAVITDADVDMAYGQFLAAAQNAALNDPAGYDSNSMYMSVYIPEGSRMADVILLKNADDAVCGEVADKLAGGGNTADIAKEYGAQVQTGVTILRESSAYPEKLRETLYALKAVGDVSGAARTDNGTYIVRYAGEAVISDEDTQKLRADLREQLESRKEDTVQSRMYSEWAEKYKYTIDYDLLKLDRS